MGAASSTKESNSEVLGRSTAPEGFVGRPCTPLRHRCPKLAEAPEKVMERGEPGDSECPVEQPGRPNTPPIVRSRQRPKASRGYGESYKEADANGTGIYPSSSTPCVKSFAPISSEGIGHGLCFRIEQPSSGEHHPPRPRDMGSGNPGDTHTTTSSRSTPSNPPAVVVDNWGAYEDGEEHSKTAKKEEEGNNGSSGKELPRPSISCRHTDSASREEETNRFTPLDGPTEGLTTTPMYAAEDRKEDESTHNSSQIREKEGEQRIMQRSILFNNNSAKNGGSQNGMVEGAGAGSPSVYLMEAIGFRREQVSASRVGQPPPKRITFDSRIETGVLGEEGQKFHNHASRGGGRGGGNYDENHHAGFKFRTRPHVWMKPARISGWNRTFASVPTNSWSSGSTRSGPGGKSRGIPVHQHCANSLCATTGTATTTTTNPGVSAMSGKASTTTTRSDTQHTVGQPTPTVLVPRAQAAHESPDAAWHPSMGASGTPTTNSSSKINEKNLADEKVCGAAANTSTSTSTKPIPEQFPMQPHAALIEEMKQNIARIQAEMEKQKEALAEAEQANDISSSAAQGENLKDRFSIVEMPQ